MTRAKLSRAQVAHYLGVQPETITKYATANARARYNFPAPDGRVGRSPYWYLSTIKRWDGRRAGQGAGGGPKPKVST